MPMSLELINQYFLSECLERINYEKYNTGTAQPKLNREVCQKIKVILPNFNEQNKIANLLINLDKKLKLLEEKHEYYLYFKKYLMQQIFAQNLRFDKSPITKRNTIPFSLISAYLVLRMVLISQFLISQVMESIPSTYH